MIKYCHSAGQLVVKATDDVVVSRKLLALMLLNCLLLFFNHLKLELLILFLTWCHADTLSNVMSCFLMTVMKHI